MPIFEPPTIPDPVPQEQSRSPLPASPYAGLEHHELLQLIDELNDERARARFREGMWMAFFAHLVLFALLYFVPTWLFHGVKVINPIDAMQEHDRQITLNPDTMKSLDNTRSGSRPKAAPPTKALNQQTLQQLKEMQKLSEEEAAARRQEQQQQKSPQTPAPPPPPQTQAKNEPLLPLPNAPKPSQSALPDIPTPQSQQQASNAPAANNDDAFSRQIREAARQAIKNNAGGGTTYGNAGNGIKNHGLAAGMGIISDTMGVNFDPWLQRLQYIIQKAWEPLIPESAYPPLSKQGVVGIRFTIDKNGNLEDDMVLVTPSGDVALDKAAWGAIKSPAPFPPLPKEFKGRNIVIQGGFYYNVPPGQ